jgi:hypothetical protein
MKRGLVAFSLALLLALAALGGGWKWNHHGPGSTGPRAAVAGDSASMPNGWTWDS